MVFFGDGAVQGGNFHESVNLAALWGLPVVFVCENNGFAEFTPRSAHTDVERVTDVVAPYGFERRRSTATSPRGARGVRRVPRGARRAGPMLLECLTHRLRGHYEGDPQRYREAAAEEWQELDPICACATRRREGWLDERTPSQLEQGARARSRRRSASRARARSLLRG